MSDTGHWSEDLNNTDGEEGPELEDELGYGKSEDERDASSHSSGDDDADFSGMSPQDRKKMALFPPIASVCSALGGYEEFIDEQGRVYTEYSLGDQVVGCLKDLKRFWRMDEKDDDRTVARIFSEVGVLKNDLLPILLSTLGTSAKGDRIALACVELIGAMTWPIDVAEELRDAKLQDQLTRSIDYNTIITAQLNYKASILRTGALRAMFGLMTPCLSKTRKERTTKDENIISLVLHTFRNLAYLKDRPLTSTSSNAIESSQLQSELIKQLAEEHIFDLLIAIASNSGGTGGTGGDYANWNFVALDIFHLIFRGVRPAELMVEEEKVEENRLSDLLEREDNSKRGLARKSNSRHSRFGTTVALKAGSRQYILHKQSTLSEGAQKTMDKIKRIKAKKVRQDDDLQPPSTLRPFAFKHLRQVAVSFIDSAFNPFFSSVLKDIRMERLKVKETDTIRFLFLSSFFLEFFLHLYQEQKDRGVDSESEEWRDLGLISELTEPSTIGYITLRMKKMLDEKPPQWTELHAGVDCFVQILLVIEALQLSPIEEYRDVAEVLQNKLYYEAETLEMVVNLLAKYNAQSLKFLDSVMHLSYTLLRMLEKYSKSKGYMFVRKKKNGTGKRKKNKGKNVEDEEGDGIGMGDEEEEVDRGTLAFKEHAFMFDQYEDQFANENTLATCMIYLEGYKNFTNPEQMKRIVSLMHRQAVKAKCEGLFFKPTVLELFQRILDDDSLDAMRDSGAADLKKLIEYILKKFFKAVKETPMLLVEIFYPKTKSQLVKMKMGEMDPYATSDDDDFSSKKFKAMGEVEVTPGFSITQQIGIAVAVLVDADQKLLVDFVLSQLAAAASDRKEIVVLTDGDNEAVDDDLDPDSDEAIRRKAGRLLGPSKDAIALFLAHNIDFSDEAEKRAGSTNVHFKLLLRLLKWVSTEVPDSDELTWSIPSDILPTSLDTDYKIISDFLLDPVDPTNGKSAADLLRKQRKKPIRKRRELLPDEEGELGDEEDAPTKKRAKKTKEEAMQYKSAQFIEDSDEEDDPEKDALFFAAEAALRAQLGQGGVVAPGGGASQGGIALSKGTKKKKSAKKIVAAPLIMKKGKKAKKLEKSNYVEAEVSDLSDDGGLIDNLRKHVAASTTDDATATPAPSPPASSTEHQSSSSSSAAPSRKRAPSTTSASSEPIEARTKATPPVTEDRIDGDRSESEEPVQPIAKKRRVIVDSDDED